MNLSLNNVDLICIDGRADYSQIENSVSALKISCRDIEFANILFFSALPVRIECKNYTNVIIPEIKSTQEYSKFVVEEFHKYIVSDHLLIVQEDGFVVRADLWSDDFLSYDYVGALWPANWPGDRPGRVGNGGFSLRSKRLMNFVANSLDFSKSASKIEDNFICLENRHIIESAGFRFAPPNIAARFSWENPIGESSFGNSFGFHGHNILCEINYLPLLNAI